MSKKFILFILINLFLLPLAFSQKAYDVINYSGKTETMLIKFTLADGYIEASQLTTTDFKSKKTASFIPIDGGVAENKEMKFYHYSETGETFSDYFILEGIEEYYESIPVKICGKYYDGEKVIKFTLTKL